MAENKKKQKRAAAESGDAEQNGAEGAGEQLSKAERRKARAERKEGRAATAEPAAADGEGSGAQPADLEARLARIEEAVANQAERSEALIAKLDEILNEARGSAGEPESTAQPAE